MTNQQLLAQRAERIADMFHRKIERAFSDGAFDSDQVREWAEEIGTFNAYYVLACGKRLSEEGKKYVAEQVSLIENIYPEHKE